MSKIAFAAVLAAALAPLAVRAEALTGVVEFTGTPPPVVKLDREADSYCAKKPANDESVVVKSFLVIDAATPSCPVAIWDYDGARLYPLADSLDDFLDGRASREEGRFQPKFRLS